MTNPFISDAKRTWDRRFECPDFLFGTEPNAYLVRQRHLLQSGQSALAVADGEGRNSVWLAQQGLSVDAFDISPVGVAKARQFAVNRSVAVNFNVCDVDGWHWQSNAYDVVAAIFIQFADPSMRGRLFANMIDTLKPGGHLILQGYTPRQLVYNTGGPGILEHLYTEELLREAFSGLKIVDLQDYEEVLQEGRQHSGRSALIGMVAQKPEA